MFAFAKTLLRIPTLLFVRAIIIPVFVIWAVLAAPIFLALIFVTSESEEEFKKDFRDLIKDFSEIIMLLWRTKT